jgi:predicted pyridoxine 5'-phosphate oxidase superfamily flavin-nucleotide-binding protein
MRDFLPQQHQDFYRLLPFIAMSSVDSSGRNWCQVVAGPPGFVDTSNNRLVRVNSLPFAFELVVGAPVGVLGIQLSTRRRNKFKGVISRVGDSFFDIAVLQTVGNCPQYIFSRDAVFAPPLRSAASSDSRVVMSRELNDEAVKLISSCDFFFLGTVQADRKAAEVNHRGGKAGFVKVLSRTQLVFPDFTGNFHFSSLGNIESTGLCSAIFIDVNTSETLLITCKASIDWDSELVSAFAGAERLVKMEVIEVARPLMPLPLRFQGGGKERTR